MVTLDVRVAKNTLLEVPGPDEDLPVDLEPWTEGSSLLMSTISLPAFGIRLEVFRTLLRLATLEEPAPHLSLGARAPIISGHMLNTLRIQSIGDHNVSSG